MKKTPPITDEDIRLFRDAVSGAKPLPQDCHLPERPKRRPKKAVTLANSSPDSHLFYFSDLYEGVFPDSGALSFFQPGEDPHLPKRLKRGEFQPAVVLDLHGLTQEKAKEELAGLLAYCQQEHLNCACIVHGKGLGILARRVPNWLVQHPNVRAFHTAPTEWGRDGALLVLLKTPQ
ncbi:endonuclease SmrB [Rheinheimera sp.]|uniref:endonuclease SmrB n=1 Tax=Rheinheimera sp. TaxID=1869214 RepID=UPI00307DB4EA